MRLRKIFILESAKEEFKDIKKYVRQEFGDEVWRAVHVQFKQSFQLIQDKPTLGSSIDLLAELGVHNIRYVLVRQTKIVYEFDDDKVLIHMFINTRRDFRAHLLQRLLRL